MLNPPAQFGRRLIYNISTRTLIALSCFGLVKFSGSRDTKTSVNKRLLCHYFFYAVSASGIFELSQIMRQLVVLLHSTLPQGSNPYS